MLERISYCANETWDPKSMLRQGWLYSRMLNTCRRGNLQVLKFCMSPVSLQDEYPWSRIRGHLTFEAAANDQKAVVSYFQGKRSSIQFSTFTVFFDGLKCNAVDRAALAGQFEKVTCLLERWCPAYGLPRQNFKELIKRWSKAVNDGNTRVAAALVRILDRESSSQGYKNHTHLNAFVNSPFKGTHPEIYVWTLVEHLASAVVDRERDIVKLLLGGGANPNGEELSQSSLKLDGDLKKKSRVVGPNDQYILIVAAKHSSSEIVSDLLQAGADKEVQDELGRTALLCAAKAWNVPIINTLLNAGASLTSRDNAGRGVLWIAVEIQDLNLVHYLLGLQIKLLKKRPRSCYSRARTAAKRLNLRYHTSKKDPKKGTSLREFPPFAGCIERQLNSRTSTRWGEGLSFRRSGIEAFLRLQKMRCRMKLMSN